MIGLCRVQHSHNPRERERDGKNSSVRKCMWHFSFFVHSIASLLFYVPHTKATTPFIDSFHTFIWNHDRDAFNAAIKTNYIVSTLTSLPVLSPSSSVGFPVGFFFALVSLSPFIFYSHFFSNSRNELS